jgi:DNA-binding GntR family transcriptional regulator
MRESDSTLMRADLQDHVYACLKDGLATRKLAPGEKLSLQELAQACGVSRSPVQQALTRLVSPRARRGQAASRPVREAAAGRLGL